MKNVILPKWSYVLVIALLSGLASVIQAIGAPVFQMRMVLAEGPQAAPPRNAERMNLVTSTNTSGKWTGEILWVSRTLLIDESDLKKASVTTSTLRTSNVPGKPELAIVFTPTGRKHFADVTRHSINKRLAIIIDGHIISAPVIKTEILGGKVTIEGHLTRSEATALSNKINQALNK